MRKFIGSSRARRIRRAGMLAGCAPLLCATAHAFTIESGNPDIAIRLDSEARYNAGWRAQKIDPRMRLSNPGAPVLSAIGDNQFDRGDMMLNRFDLFTEFDVVYKDRTGIRITGAAWYDPTYGKKVNDPTGTINNWYANGEYSPYARRYITGPSAEFLDAFAFTTVDMGQMTASAKLGRHSVYWGNSLFPQSYHSAIAYDQSPVDNQKGAASPGAQTKEILLPLNQLTANLAITPELSVAGLYTLEWRHRRYPEAGTFYEYFAGAFWGPNGPSALPEKYRPPKRGGDWGLMLKYGPESWGGSNVSLVYREFYEKMIGTLYSPDFGASIGMGYNDQKNRLVGLAGETNLWGLNFGAELTYRQNTSLKTAAAVSALLDSDRPARGNTVGALVNVVKLLPKTSLWEAGELAMELAYSKVRKVTYNPGLNGMGAFFTGNAPGTGAGYQEAGSAFCQNDAGAFGAGNESNGCISKGGSWIISANFQPRWLQVAPGVDLSAPMFVSYGLKGNANAASMAEKQVLYQVGVQFDVRQKHVIKLAYTGGHS
ncbi:MAG TPA: DUF1302 family protein, partial [Ramlibacter sp.]|nr:DUF1302 family protein [Ramlibacter sp.]